MTQLASRRATIALLAVAAACGLISTAEAGTGLAVLALATGPALFAVPPRGRGWLGGAVVVIGVGAGALGDLGGDVLSWGAVAALSAAGVLIAVGGRSWPALSGRYGSANGSDGGSSVGAEPTDFWQSLDRGHDPTLTPPREPGADKRPPDGTDVH